MLDRTLAQQRPRVAGGKDELGEALRRDEGDDDRDRALLVSSTRKPAVKPGPIAVISMRWRGASRSLRSST